MIINKTGEIIPGFYVLGASEMPVYLLDGERPAIFEAGLSCLGLAYERDLKKILGNRQPEFLFLTHVHFDHCGSAAYLKKLFPQMQIAASAKAASIVTRPNALAQMALLNQAAAEAVRRWHPDLEQSGPFEGFAVDRILEDGERLTLGSATVEVIGAPGHTWDSLSFYVPERRLLIASESAGCQDSAGQIITEFLVDYEAYMKTIQRLAALKVEVLCQGHRLVFTGQEARDFFPRSLEATGEYKARVERLLKEEGGDVDRTLARLKALEYDPLPEPKQPEPAYLLNLGIRVRHLAEKLSGSGPF